MIIIAQDIVYVNFKKTQYMTFRNQKANLYATNLEFF